MATNSQEFDRTRRRLDKLARSGFAPALARGGATVWAVEARKRARVDTGNMRDRTEVVDYGGTPAHGWADIESGADYAGFQEFGTAYVTPNYFFRGGRDMADRHLASMGGRVATEIEKILKGGSLDLGAFE